MLVQEVLYLLSEVDFSGGSRMDSHLDRLQATKCLLELDSLDGVGAQV